MLRGRVRELEGDGAGVEVLNWQRERRRGRLQRCLQAVPLLP